MKASEDELRAFVGPNADYYLKAWAGADPNGGWQTLRWNWPAFFFNVFWMLYRRMYKYFWIFFAALFVIGVVKAIVEHILHIPPGLHWFDLPINLAVAVFFGAYGSWFYYRHAHWRIAQTKAYHTDREALVKAGGVRWFWPVVLGLFTALVLLLAVTLPGLVKRP